MKRFLYVFLISGMTSFCFFYSPSMLAVSLSNAATTAVSVNSAFSGQMISNPTRLSMIFTDEDGSQRTSSSQGCLVLHNMNIHLTRGDELNWNVAIHEWNSQVFLNDFNNANQVTNGRIENTCENDVSGYVNNLSCTDIRCATSFSSGWVTFKGRHVCQADVRDVVLGQINKGDTKSSSLSISKSGRGNGTVKLTGDDLTSSGDLHLGGDKNLIVRPSESAYISSDNGKGIWISDASRNTIPLDINVGRNANTGEHKSVLTATLTCE